jgi:transglutaminase-like putative cysteine protease
MRRHLTIRHITEYRYAEAVTFGRHRMMFRPRDSHTLRLTDSTLNISPAPEGVRWAYDVFGNSVAHAEFGNLTSDTLRFESMISLLHYEASEPAHLLSPAAEHFPFRYADDELPDLLPVMAMHADAGAQRVMEWASAIARGKAATLELLSALMTEIRTAISYRRRVTMGTQTPSETLELRTGTCRDFAWLMIEILRGLGFAARFVSGYIYCPGQTSHQGGGATHAWVQVYLPGSGWIEMDPTNGIFGNRDLIRIAVARHPQQAKPLSGSFVGKRATYRGIEVSVSVLDADPVKMSPHDRQ